MKKTLNKLNLALILALISISFGSALIVNDVNQGELYPGEQTSINIEVENNLNDDVEDASLRLELQGTQFITIGGSEKNKDEINEDESETFNFVIKASQDITPGDYNLPYTISYLIPAINGSDIKIEKKGTIGISVGAKTELDYTSAVENPVIGQKGKVSLKIINKGFADIKFVSVKIIPKGYTLLSGDQVYIGDIGSDDFETASYDVIFNSQNAGVDAIVEYKDFNNKKITQNINLPIKVYTQEQALEAGIIQKNNSWSYAVVVIALIIIWFAYRTIRKRRKKKQREEGK